jgi:multisubunit Na+/H+ antiporter MnhB subunit
MLLTAVILCALSLLLIGLIRKMNHSRSRRKKAWVLPLNIVAFVLGIIGLYYLYLFLDSVQY